MFTFKLEPVLKLRKRTEERLQIELAELKLSYEREKEKLKELIHTKNRCERDIREKYGKEETTLSEVLLYIHYLEKLKMDIEQQEQLLRKIEGQVEDKRNELLKASQERKIIEKLRENSEREYREAENRKERVFLDEIATNKFIRKTLSRG